MKSKKGFTLVELIAVLAVTSILLGVIISIFLQSISLFKIDETKAANQDSLNIASTSFESKVRFAYAVSSNGSSCTVSTLTGDYIYTLNTTTHDLTVNDAYLTGRIASFSCTVNGSEITLSLTTINDATGYPQSLITTMVIRKGE